MSFGSEIPRFRFDLYIHSHAHISNKRSYQNTHSNISTIINMLFFFINSRSYYGFYIQYSFISSIKDHSAQNGSSYCTKWDRWMLFNIQKQISWPTSYTIRFFLCITKHSKHNTRAVRLLRQPLFFTTQLLKKKKNVRNNLLLQQILNWNNSKLLILIPTIIFITLFFLYTNCWALSFSKLVQFLCVHSTDTYTTQACRLWKLSRSCHTSPSEEKKKCFNINFSC